MAMPRCTRRSGSGSSAGGHRRVLFARRRTRWVKPPTLLRPVRRRLRRHAGTSSDALGRGVLTFPDQWCSQPSCYQTLRAGNLAPGGRDATGRHLRADRPHRRRGQPVGPQRVSCVGLARRGLRLHGGGIAAVRRPSQPGALVSVSRLPVLRRRRVRAGSSDCVGSSPSYYETLQAADVDGVAGDELLRAPATDCG